MFRALRKLLGPTSTSPLDLRWKKHGGWLAASLVATVPPAPRKTAIEAAACATNELGAQPLASEYGEAGATRMPDVVRSSSRCGDLYAWLVQQRPTEIVIEFGSAFGVSGMYFASGLEAAARGHLYSFEINPAWADIAERNIRSISARVTLTRGAFEDHIASISGPVDLALVDGIHTYAFVMRQFALLQPRMRAGGLIIVDDIDFNRPNAGMAEAWQEIVSSPHVVGAVEIGSRVGIVEVA